MYLLCTLSSAQEEHLHRTRGFRGPIVALIFLHVPHGGGVCTATWRFPPGTSAWPSRVNSGYIQAWDLHCLSDPEWSSKVRLDFFAKVFPSEDKPQPLCTLLSLELLLFLFSP